MQDSEMEVSLFRPTEWAVAAAALVAFQTAVRAEECGAILQYGIWETYTEKDSLTDNQSFWNWACNAQSSSNEQDLGASRDAYGRLTYHGSSASSESACHAAEGAKVISEDRRVSWRRAADVVVKAWSDCMDSLGSHASIIYRADPLSFTIRLTRRGDEKSRPNDEVATIRFQPHDEIECTLQGSALTSGISFTAEHVLSCTRKTERPVSIDINFAHGKGSESYFLNEIFHPSIAFSSENYTTMEGIEWDTEQGPNYIHNGKPYGAHKSNMAEYEFVSPAAGHYSLRIHYGLQEARPIRITLNGRRLPGEYLTSGAPAFDPSKWEDIPGVELRVGFNRLRLERNDVFPHIGDIRFIPEQ